MNRVIKFRAWDKTAKRMFQVGESPNHDTLWFPLGEARYSNLQNGSGGDEYELMQFTGLNDKNGVEIYEGDIVSAPHYIVGPEPAYFENHLVTFDKGVFGISGVRSITPLHETEKGIEKSKEYIPNHGEVYREYQPMVEVIGNIYENPDLLEAQS